MRDFLKRQWLLLGLLAAVGLSFLIPAWGASGGYLHSEVTTKIGIVLIFFFQGWMLPTEVLTKSLLRWKAHLFTQVFIFGVFPLIVIGGDFIWGPYISEPLRVGFFFLAVLPTTISSAIVFTSQAKGSTAVSLFNTTIANVAGVILTPLWMALLVQTNMGEMDSFGAVVMKLSKLIILPLVIGQIAHVLSKGLLDRIRPYIGHFSQLVIVFIVFAAFSNSVKGGAWDGQSPMLVFVTILICLFVFLVITIVCLYVLHLLQFDQSDRAAIFFCGTQKTLATGIPLGVSLLGNDPAFGIILLPLMIYHPIQLLFGAVFIHRFQKYS